MFCIYITTNFARHDRKIQRNKIRPLLMRMKMYILRVYIYISPKNYFTRFSASFRHKTRLDGVALWKDLLYSPTGFQRTLSICPTHS